MPNFFMRERRVVRLIPHAGGCFVGAADAAFALGKRLHDLFALLPGLLAGKILPAIQGRDGLLSQRGFCQNA